MEGKLLCNEVKEEERRGEEEERRFIGNEMVWPQPLFEMRASLYGPSSFFLPSAWLDFGHAVDS